MTLLEAVLALLDRERVAHALIGAGALALYGVVRSTLDVDLLVVDPRCLDSPFWHDLSAGGAEVEVRLAGGEDPLAGVVRLAKRGERSVDVIVGRAPWQRRAVERALGGIVQSLAVPVVQPGDLVRLKLYAGGTQDAWDIASLLAVAEDADRRQLVEAEADLDELPTDARRLWRTILAGG